MLTDTQREVLGRLAGGAELQSSEDGGAPYSTLAWTPTPITDAEVEGLESAGLIECTLYYDAPRAYDITDAGRKALEEKTL